MNRRHALICPLLVLSFLLLAGCGAVVTRPTETPISSATPTATVAPPTVAPSPTPDTYTPPPTATPTVTPEPIIYRIKQGENLNIIANRFGVPHDLLRDVNGIEDERALQVGQQLIIPVGGWTGPVEPTPTVTPTAMPATIQNVYFHPSPLGELAVLGEVANPGAVDLERVQVRITLFDGLDRLLESKTAFTALDMVPPGGSAPFSLLFPEAPDDYQTFQAELLSAAPAYLGSLVRDFEYHDVEEDRETPGLLRLSGRIRNAGDVEAADVLLTVTAYDQQGRVIGLRTVSPTPDAIPFGGGEADFQIEVVSAGYVTTYTIQTEGWRAAPAP